MTSEVWDPINEVAERGRDEIPCDRILELRVPLESAGIIREPVATFFDGERQLILERKAISEVPAAHSIF
jgi:hypothetical protein